MKHLVTFQVLSITNPAPVDGIRQSFHPLSKYYSRLQRHGPQQYHDLNNDSSDHRFISFHMIGKMD